jgi:chromosome segregation ATPase
MSIPDAPKIDLEARLHEFQKNIDACRTLVYELFNGLRDEIAKGLGCRVEILEQDFRVYRREIAPLAEEFPTFKSSVSKKFKGLRSEFTAFSEQFAGMDAKHTDLQTDLEAIRRESREAIENAEHLLAARLAEQNDSLSQYAQTLATEPYSKIADTVAASQAETQAALEDLRKSVHRLSSQVKSEGTRVDGLIDEDRASLAAATAELRSFATTAVEASKTEIFGELANTRKGDLADLNRAFEGHRGRLEAIEREVPQMRENGGKIGELEAEIQRVDRTLTKKANKSERERLEFADRITSELGEANRTLTIFLGDSKMTIADLVNMNDVTRRSLTTRIEEIEANVDPIKTDATAQISTLEKGIAAKLQKAKTDLDAAVDALKREIAQGDGQLNEQIAAVDERIGRETGDLQTRIDTVAEAAKRRTASLKTQLQQATADQTAETEALGEQIAAVKTELSEAVAADGRRLEELSDELAGLRGDTDVDMATLVRRIGKQKRKIEAFQEETTAQLALYDEDAKDRFDRATKAVRATSRMMKTELETVQDSMKTFAAQTEKSLNKSIASIRTEFETAVKAASVRDKRIKRAVAEMTDENQKIVGEQKRFSADLKSLETELEGQTSEIRSNIAKIREVQLSGVTEVSERLDKLEHVTLVGFADQLQTFQNNFTVFQSRSLEGRNELQSAFRTLEKKQRVESERVTAGLAELRMSIASEVARSDRLVDADSTAELEEKVEELIAKVTPLQKFCNSAKDSLATLTREVSELSAQTATDRVETEKFQLQCTHSISNAEDQLSAVVRKQAQLETASSGLGRHCEQIIEQANQELSESMESLFLKYRDETRKAISDYRAATQADLAALRYTVTGQKSQGADPAPGFRSTQRSPASQKP